MPWFHYVSYFFGGAFLTNAILHLVPGLTGRAFQSPFAKPTGRGLSSSTVNVRWAFFNLVVAYVPICRVGAFDPRAMADVVPAGLGILVKSLVSARGFGRFYGGNAPEQSA
jgi:hypothetical protein